MEKLYVSDREVSGRFGKHRSWAWRKLKLDPTFPRPVSLSTKCTRWRLKDIEAWEEQRAHAAA